jgi:DNA-binding GntR family transcriptional regulator
VISPHREAPVYLQVAAALRAQIADGTLAPGEELRSEPDLAYDFDVGKDSIRNALAVLRSEGLVVSRRGYRTRVRKPPELTRVQVPRGTVITSRMPTPDERERWGMPAGVPVLVAGGEVHPADRYALVTE